MSNVSLKCVNCNSGFLKILGEYNRQIREKGPNVNFFCNAKCAGIYINSLRKNPDVNKTCECGKIFVTNTGSTYCSRKCASLFSFTEDRKRKVLAASSNTRFTSHAQGLKTSASSLRKREWNKYIFIHEFLIKNFIEHTFEYHLPGSRFIYDLLVADIKLLIEFDERYHDFEVQRQLDEDKNLAAVRNGFKIVRIKVVNNGQPYSVEVIVHVLTKHGLSINPIVLSEINSVSDTASP